MTRRCFQPNVGRGCVPLQQRSQHRYPIGDLPRCFQDQFLPVKKRSARRVSLSCCFSFKKDYDREGDLEACLDGAASAVCEFKPNSY